MAGAKEIRTKIKSIQNTQKITRAMEMVAASKMRKAQDRMRQTRPYARHILDVVQHVARSNTEYRHQFLEDRAEKSRVGLIIVSTDKGLCGGLNMNLFKTAVTQMKDWHEGGLEVDVCVVGAKASAFFGRSGANMVAKAEQLGDAPSISDLLGTVKVMLDGFSCKKLDRLYVVYNEFVNTMTQKPKVQQLLPIPKADDERLEHHWDYIYEPDSKEILDGLLSRFIELQVYQSVVENVACEQAARMIAMKSASDNAGELIDELQLVYNKARQASITQELSEIVAGAAAV